MPKQKANTHLLKEVFRNKPISELQELSASLGTSKRTVMRYLRKVGYHTSYNLNSRYYALEGTPQFNEQGLWGFEGIWFSRYATLRKTVRSLVEKSEAGMTSSELKRELHVRVDSRMSIFVTDGEVSSERYGHICVYYSAKGPRRDVQMANRAKTLKKAKKTDTGRKKVISNREMAMNVIETLVTKIEHPDWEAVEISKDLVRRGIDMPVEGVEATFEFLKLSKKNSKRET
ncbi:hypothetical protein LCGC14_1469370 [marine sediment metagenome]|uniref:Uncharacterized protein n=1 Tax=marine sediment metagenome TaxID=412755 RepID=A0A0F9JYP7_9ZZZZ